jgi:hypothetical protein
MLSLPLPERYCEDCDCPLESEDALEYGVCDICFDNKCLEDEE